MDRNNAAVILVLIIVGFFAVALHQNWFPRDISTAAVLGLIVAVIVGGLAFIVKRGTK